MSHRAAISVSLCGGSHYRIFIAWNLQPGLYCLSRLNDNKNQRTVLYLLDRSIHDREAQSIQHCVKEVVEHICFDHTEYFYGDGLAPIFPYTIYHLTYYWSDAADIQAVNGTPAHCADAIRYSVRTPPQGTSLLSAHPVLA